MVKKIIVIVLLAILCFSSIKIIISEVSELSYTAEVYSKYKSGEYTNGSITASGEYLDIKEHIKHLKGLIFESISCTLFYLCIDAVSAFAIYELIRSIRHPMRRAELERELAELKKTE